jgi:uncharacterized membrane protein
MWFIGLLLGAVIGAAVADFEGAFYGAVLGALAGYAGRLAMGRSTEARLRKLEQQVAELRAALAAASQSVAAPAAPSAVEATAPSEPVRESVPPPQRAGTPAPAHPETAPEPARTAGAPEPAAAQPPAWLHLLLGGNTVVRVGVIVLFFGVAFLLKFAYEHARVPIEVRLIAVAAGAIALLLVGWRLRHSRPGYALALQGGGVGVLYLTVFASLRLYALLPPGAALVLLILIAALSAAAAVLQNSQSLAILGASGGFLAPVLTSTGGGNHVMLFGYYAVLNAGILGVAWYKSWRPLNLVGFAFTFGIGAAWGAQFYRPELYASTQPFLILFFLMYLAIPVLFARREATRPERYLDATLVFGVPLLVFGFQLRLTHAIEYGAAFSALAVSLVYLVVARSLYARHRDVLRMLTEAFLALGIVFATLAVPLALDGRWTAAVWALEGAALVWVGVRQNRRLARAFGLLLQLAAGIAFADSASAAYARPPVLNSFYLGCLLIALAGMFSNWYLERHRQDLKRAQPWAAIVVFFWGLAWWTLGGMQEIETHARARFEPDIALLFFAGSCAAFGWLHRRIGWRLALYCAFALLPLMAITGLVAATAYGKPHPLADLGWIAWPAAFAVHLWLLRRHEHAQPQWLDHVHAGSIWVLAAIGAWQVAWTIDEVVASQPTWALIGWALLPGALVVALALWGERRSWPVSAHLRAYLLNGAAPVSAFLWCWVIYGSLTSDGDPAPLPYMPVLSPLDLTQIGALLAIALWLHKAHGLRLVDLTGERAALAYALIGAAAFIAANGMLLRTLHYWAEVPLSLQAMTRSMLVQAAFSIFWSALALGAMVAATRLRLRALWITGAALMGVVVIKLFLVDLSNVGGVERIVSFIGVGLLMLLIGYMSPVPPRTQERPE